MKFLLVLMLLLLAACGSGAGVTVPTTADEIGSHVLIWQDPARPVVCYMYNDGNYGTEWECVKIN